MGNSLSPDFWRIVLPALVGIILWFCNERSKRVWEQFKRKEEHYKELLRCLRGFYVSTHDKELKGQFLHQVNLLWLYAPDNVIHAAYGFLDKVRMAVSYSDSEKELAVGVLVKAIRTDLLSHSIVKKTLLKAEDFHHLAPAENVQLQTQGNVPAEQQH